MAWPTSAVNALPTNVDATYADSGTDASVKLHQQYHDTVHTALQAAPTTFAPFAQAWQFPVENYGAKGDGTTDDTAAVNAAVAAAVAYAQANRQYAEVLFKDRTYLIAGALTQGGTTKGNAQIPLPIIAPTAAKVTLAFIGPGDTASLPHWQQTVQQAPGAVLKTSSAGGYDNTYGWPSVIGGPAPEQGYGTTNAVFNNMCVVIDGLTIQAPQNPNIAGVDLAGVAECNVNMLGVEATQTPATANAANVTNYAFGLRMPYTGNNAYCDIGRYSCEGFRRGAILGEHSSFDSIRAVYCYSGIGVAGSAPHGITGRYACVESCATGIEYIAITPSPAYGANNGGVPISLQMLDVESLTTYLVDDVGSHLFGHVGFVNNGGPPNTISVNGAGSVKVVDLEQAAGTLTAPTVPASATALVNPFWRDSAVTVTGGTVTAITVDGQALGVTSGTVFVPSGKPITLTYSVAPTWHWVAL